MGDSDASNSSSSSPRRRSSYDHDSASETESRQDGSSRAALRQLQATLTGAMEHLEGAQLQFFHVQRALSARQRRRRRPPAMDDASEPSWSLRVRLYTDFWTQFEAQVRTALAPCDDTDRALAALTVLARNVWGEMREPPASVFPHEPLMLVPADEDAGSRRPSGGNETTTVTAPLATLNVLADAAGSERKKPKAKPTSTAPAAAGSSRKSLAKPANQRKRRFQLGASVYRTLAGQEAAKVRAEAEAKAKYSNNVSPHENGRSDTKPVTGASTEPSGAKKRKTDVRSLVAVDADSDIDTPQAVRTSPEAAASDHEVANGVSPPPLHGPRRQRREDVLARMRTRVQEQLTANEVWPTLALPFPKHLLAFDTTAHAQLAHEHTRFWTQNIASFLDIVYAHAPQANRARLHQSKMRLLRRQRVLLSEYIETLGVAAVARLLLASDARDAFFFVKKYIALEQLSPTQLEQHLTHVHTPWTSPVTRSRQVSWYEIFTRKGATKQVLVDASPRVKQLIAQAHVQGDLAFDDVWMTQLATQAPWKQMLDAYGRAPDDDDEGDDGPQSPPARKKSTTGASPRTIGRVAIKEEHVGGASIYRSYSPQRGLLEQPERIVMQFSSASSDSSSSDESEFEDGCRSRASLGKRLRTSSRD